MFDDGVWLCATHVRLLRFFGPLFRSLHHVKGVFRTVQNRPGLASAFLLVRPWRFRDLTRHPSTVIRPQGGVAVPVDHLLRGAS